MGELPFKSSDFAAAWADWKQHRKEIRKKLTPTSVKRQLAKLAAMGEQRAIAALNHSILNGWQGIFEPHGNQHEHDKWTGRYDEHDHS